MICDDMPLLLWFQCDNPFSESEGNFRYCLSPKDNDEKERTLLLEIWTGKFCKEKSEILYSETAVSISEVKSDFPVRSP